MLPTRRPKKEPAAVATAIAGLSGFTEIVHLPPCHRSSLSESQMRHESQITNGARPTLASRKLGRTEYLCQSTIRLLRRQPCHELLVACLDLGDALGPGELIERFSF